MSTWPGQPLSRHPLSPDHSQLDKPVPPSLGTETNLSLLLDRTSWQNNTPTLETSPTEHELALREHQVNKAKHLEMAKLELAKREGQEFLSEANMARIKNGRSRTKALARVQENHRSVTPHHPPSARYMHRVHPPPSRIPSGHMLNASMVHRRGPPEPAARMRQISEILAHPTKRKARASLGVLNHPPRGVGHAPHPSSHARRHSGNITAKMALRAQAERLQRRRLGTLDLKARQHNLKVQALRDLRKRE
ncbi:hypothetical protein PtA15_12A137 [Puccinia triticina]|uniref:Uncharacterized protein n=1 Tax=Puccinia triticina TaxID=208348 RepID=A0ABY7CY60_9BASI|nr:uncharacterized protein PtA15_12A137 [Puccinia triticina]WAQ90151.1 hypothetical protein PtA15_12A137 [Puccinia triticina]